MRKIGRNLLEIVYFILCFAPAPLLAGYVLIDNGYPLLIASALTTPIAFLLSLLPGKLGAREAQGDVFVERRTSGGDPDPDRSLRRDTHEAVAKGRRGFPLRLVLCVILMLAVWGALFFSPEALLGVNLEEGLLRKALASLVPAVMLPLALRFCTEGASMDIRNAGVGVVLYLISGIVAHVLHSEPLMKMLALGGAAYLIVMLIQLNSRAVRMGANVREGTKPPLHMRRRNRLLVGGVIALTALIVGFSWLRERFEILWELIKKGILWLIVWLGTMGGTSGGGPGGGGGGFSPEALGLEPGEAAPFWEYLTYVGYAVAAVVMAVLLFFMFKKIGQLIAQLVRKIGAWMGRFAQSVSEDYTDEQESLMDWGETRREAAEKLRKRIGRLFQRDKKWDDMTAKERARHLVRTLYRRARLMPDGRTLRETMPQLNTDAGETLVDAYELARYSERDPDGGTIEQLRRDIRP